MRYQEKDFTHDLKWKISNTENALREYSETLLADYQSVFAKRNIKLEIEFDHIGTDYFKPGYCSSITIGTAENPSSDDEILDLFTIKIWECERIIFGMPISTHLPGSKVVGELLDESADDIRETIADYLEEFLNEEC